MRLVACLTLEQFSLLFQCVVTLSHSLSSEEVSTSLENKRLKIHLENLLCIVILKEFLLVFVVLYSTKTLCDGNRSTKVVPELQVFVFPLLLLHYRICYYSLFYFLTLKIIAFISGLLDSR